MTLKVKLSVGNVELSITRECNYCGRMKPLDQFGTNPRTQQTYSMCIFCRAKKVSARFVGRHIVDSSGRRWLVKGYMDNIDHRVQYPYTCHSVDGQFTIWHTDEANVRAGAKRAKDMK